MNPTRILWLLAAIIAVDGFTQARALDHGPAVAWSTLLFGLMFSFVTFLWYRYDSDAHDYRRSALLNVGVIALAPLAVPYYLVRSRPAGGRLMALLKFLGFSALLFVAAFAGGMASAFTG